MDVSIQIPLDDGFLRRACPSCGRQFKWWEGEGDDDDWSAVLDVIFCPYCAETATLDEWWTQEQLDYAMEVAAGPVVDELTSELERKLKGKGEFLLEFSVRSEGPRDPPQALAEPSDMLMLSPPCHPEVPLKLSEEWSPPARCLVCGSEFFY